MLFSAHQVTMCLQLGRNLALMQSNIPGICLVVSSTEQSCICLATAICFSVAPLEKTNFVVRLLCYAFVKKKLFLFWLEISLSSACIHAIFVLDWKVVFTVAGSLRNARFSPIQPVCCAPYRMNHRMLKLPAAVWALLVGMWRLLFYELIVYAVKMHCYFQANICKFPYTATVLVRCLNLFVM